MQELGGGLFQEGWGNLEVVSEERNQREAPAVQTLGGSGPAVPGHCPATNELPRPPSITALASSRSAILNATHTGPQEKQRQLRARGWRVGARVTHRSGAFRQGEHCLTPCQPGISPGTGAPPRTSCPHSSTTHSLGMPSWTIPTEQPQSAEPGAPSAQHCGQKTWE